MVKERLSGREKEKEAVDWCLAQHSKFEAAQVDESRIVGFKILRESTEEENAEAILDLIRSFANHLQLLYMPIVARN